MGMSESKSSITPRDLVSESRLDERKNIHFPTGTEAACKRLIKADGRTAFPDWVRGIVAATVQSRVRPLR